MDCARSPSEKSRALLWRNGPPRSLAVSGDFRDRDCGGLINRSSHRIRAKGTGTVRAYVSFPSAVAYANGRGLRLAPKASLPRLIGKLAARAVYGCRRCVSIVLTTLRTVGCSVHRRSIFRTALITVE